MEQLTTQVVELLTSYPLINRSINAGAIFLFLGSTFFAIYGDYSIRVYQSL